MKNKQIEKFVKRMSIWALVIAVILMIPVMGNAPWTSGDFIFAGIVLFLCAFVFEFLTRSMKNTSSKIAVGIAIIFFIILVIGWAATGPANEAQLMSR